MIISCLGLRGWRVVLPGVMVLWLWGAGAAWGAGAFQSVCVPTAAGQALTTPSSPNTCPSGRTLTSLATSTETTSLQSQITSLNGQVSTLKSQVAALQTTLSKVSYTASGLNGKPTLTISGANLQLISGSGSTSATPNGLGNIFLGYDETPGSQTGSHDLILGDHQTFTSYAGIIGGQSNTLSGPYADVFGAANVASGTASTVTGGDVNTASGSDASVSGGALNIASAAGSSVSGGYSNTASGVAATVTGGWSNLAYEPYSAILGGCANSVGGAATDPGCGGTISEFDTIAGGYLNYTAGNLGSLIAGGNHNFANGVNSLIAGGYNNVNNTGGSSQSQFGGGNEDILSQSTNNQSAVGATLFAP